MSFNIRKLLIDWNKSNNYPYFDQIYTENDISNSDIYWILIECCNPQIIDTYWNTRKGYCEITYISTLTISDNIYYIKYKELLYGNFSIYDDESVYYIEEELEYLIDSIEIVKPFEKTINIIGWRSYE